MTKQPPTSPDDPLSVDRMERFLDLWDEFESIWKNGQQPAAEVFLQDCPVSDQSEFLPRLLALEIELREKKGQTPQVADFLPRFPNNGEMVRKVFEDYAAQHNLWKMLNNVPPEQPDKPTATPEKLGRYRVTGKLGRGAFGIVYAAFDDQLGRPVAIKVPHRELIKRKGFAANYEAEAQVVAKLDHPNIVPVYDIGKTDDGLHLVVSKYIEGSNLAERIKQSPPTALESAALVATIAYALHHAHLKGLVHRDIKPANILIDQSGKAYLADFGLVLREDEFGTGPTFAGTPPYMSPEQARCEGHRVDGRSDIFSLGVVFYEMLTGRRPFQSEKRDTLLDQIISTEARPPRQIDDTIPRELERVCLKAMSKLAAHRYTTAKDMAEDLRAFLAEPDYRRPVTETKSVAAEPTPAPATPPQPSSSLAASADSTKQAIKIVPKGLRSFDADDADFFLELLPGPRDRDGIPDGLRFWLHKITAPDSERNLSVGLIYGPSGCGKSSLVKAGLLPRLPKTVEKVFIEAAAEQTEERLLARLHKQFPNRCGGRNLVDAIGALRRAGGKPDEKVLIVIDQFEQWLHARRGEENSELVRALRQCDGSRVQCLILVRDDFWMAVTRFMRALEIPIIEGETAAPVDLFDARHARRVLTMLGQAYGVLPESGKLSNDQKRFVEQAIAELSQEGKIIPVRLALFAEMVKSRTWTLATLKAIGGIEGVGVTFLDEAFAGPQTPPWRRQHGPAARAVLRALLPEPGKHIKGNMRSYQELLTASGYADRPKDFDDLMQVLKRELRLVSPSDAGGVELDSSLQQKTAEANQYYQLTHDYLVPALWEWLAREQKQTRRGRAELTLSERTSLWESQPKTRNLPTFGEWFRIRTLTKSALWTHTQRAMMHQADRKHGGQIAAGTLALLLAGLVAFWFFAELQATELVKRLASAKPSDVSGIITEMAPYRWRVNPKLEESMANPAMKNKLPFQIALLPADHSQFDEVFDRLLEATPEDFGMIRDALRPHWQKLRPRQDEELKESNKYPERRFRAACALADFDPHDARWPELAEPITALLTAQNPVSVSHWKEALQNVAGQLLQPLAVLLERDNRGPIHRLVVTRLYEDYARQQREGMRALEKQLELSATPLPNEYPANTALRQANVAAALVAFGHGERVWPMLEHKPDPTVRSQIIERMGPTGVSFSQLRNRLETEKSVSVRRALILSMGQLDMDRISRGERDRFAEDLLKLYEQDSDSGIHGACDWLLRQWGYDERLAEIVTRLSSQGISEKRNWFVNKERQTFAIIRVTEPIEFEMGPPEKKRPGKILYSYAIATKEVTFEEFSRLLSLPENSRLLPVHGPFRGSWYQAAEYCTSLSKKEDLGDSHRCYLPNSDGKFANGMELAPNWHELDGYRMPSRAEWEFACRAGAVTEWYCGIADDALLSRYASFLTNSKSLDSNRYLVGAHKPNDLGLFDMLGNMAEWSQDKFNPRPDQSQQTRSVSDKDFMINFTGHTHSERPLVTCHGTVFGGQPFYVAPKSGLERIGIRLVRRIR